jgi:hypothetical protein
LILRRNSCILNFADPLDKQTNADGKDAKVVELADSLDSGSSVRKDVRVQIPPFAPRLPGFYPEAFLYGILFYGSIINVGVQKD